jgi:hypothetical protein
MLMSKRRTTHNGRDTAGNFRVKQVDVDDVQTDQNGANVIQDDVRLGGAVEDTGPAAGERGEHIGELVDSNREDVAKVTGRAPRKRKR